MVQHPLTTKDQSSLRSRVLTLIKRGCRFPTKSNILFVCGGNKAENLRPKFREHCKEHKDFLFFQPEYAIDSVLADNEEAFNLSEFEALVGHLSLAIVIFPEAPGSCAEAGYFSAIETLRVRTILVLDQSKLKEDSFLSIGPAKLIGDNTMYHPQIHFDYENPDFDLILAQIRNKLGQRRTRSWKDAHFRDYSHYDLFSLICCIFDILQVASTEDVTYLLKGLFSGKAEQKRIRHLISILLGAKLIESRGDEDGYRWIGGGSLGLDVKDGFKEDRNAIRIEIMQLLVGAGWLKEEQITNAA